MKKLILALLLCFTASSLLVPGSHQANGQEKVVTAAQVNGTWRSGHNRFYIWALGQQKLKVEFFGMYEYKTPSGPMANMGSARGIARIEGDTAIFKPSDLDEDDDCKITMRFTKGKLIVEQEGACRFGLNVGPAGTYRRTSKAKPKFEESP
ncbi:MAG TPA: hypothetical protein VJP89_05625 [Pyrinomonadaceae bacterium]|nr:hypothetical protein [Pyrinomonadaceae bacterium]